MQDLKKFFGETLLASGMLTPEQIRNILTYQKEHPDMLFGQIALHLGYLSKEVLEKYLK